MPNWPARSMNETYALLTAQGAPFEMRDELVNGVALHCYVKALPTLRTVFDRARAFGEREHLVYLDERVTFAAHHRAAAHLAAAFARDYGLRKGDRVAIAMRNLPEWVVAFWASVAAGHVAVPINCWGSADDIAYAIADSGASVVLADADRLDRLAPLLPGLALNGLIAVRTPTGRLHGATPIEAIIGAPNDYAALPEADIPDPGLVPDDNATIFYTSGTTGRPKGALGSHRNITTNIVNIGLRVARAALRRGEPLPKPDPSVQRVTLLPTPLFHVTGTHSGIVPALLGGAKVVLMYKWDAATALELVAQERVNTIVTVPTMSWHLVDPALPLIGDLTSLDTITYGGAPASALLHDRLAERFPGIFLANGFGMTETSSVVASNSAEDFAFRPDAAGSFMPCNDIRVVDDQDRDVAPGAAGELIVRGPNVIKGYWNRPEETAEAFRDGWLRTGDIVRVDEDGFCFALDRARDIIIRGGENIYCVEVEQLLASHPDIVEAAVVGLPDPILGEIVAAVLRHHEGRAPDAPAVTAWAAERTAPYKIPTRFFWMNGPLPRNVAGKLVKRDLKALFELQPETGEKNAKS